MVKRAYSLVLFLLFVCIWIYPISAEMYQWTDENGVLHFSDTPPSHDVEGIKSQETYDAPNEKGSSKSDSSQNKSEQPPIENQEPLKVLTSDLLGKWKHIGISKSLSSKKLQKPYKPQSWEFRANGAVIYRIGNKTNKCPFHINGNEIVTLPFPKMYPKDTKSFIVVKISTNGMIWKDPSWNSFIHVERGY